MSQLRIIRAVVVDDEPLARSRLKRLLLIETAVNVVAEFGDGLSAARALPGLAADVVFLDVRMPELSGFDLVRLLPVESRAHVVFVTAHDNHAVDAFKVRALDYLVKPVGQERLHDTIVRVRGLLSNHSDSSLMSRSDRISVPDGARMRLVLTQEIDHVIAKGNYVEIHVGQKRFFLRQTMAGIHGLLDPSQFLRVHRSHIVRLDIVEQIELYQAGRYVLRLTDGVRIISGRSYRQAIIRACGIGGGLGTSRPNDQSI